MPLYASVNLFVHILQNPECTSAQSNLVLLDIAAGFFARLEFATDGNLSLPFARDIATLARQAVENHRTAANSLPDAELAGQPASVIAEPMLETPFIGDASALTAASINEDVSDSPGLWWRS